MTKKPKVTETQDVVLTLAPISLHETKNNLFFASSYYVVDFPSHKVVVHEVAPIGWDAYLPPYNIPPFVVK